LRGTRGRLERLRLVVLCAGALATTSGTTGEPYAGRTEPDLVRLPRAAPLETLQAIAELFGVNGSVVSKLRELLQ
jgi:hypothetical protein